MILRFSGLVEEGDSYRVETYEPEGAIIIGGRDVVGEIAAADFKGKVTIGILDKRFDGDLSVITGWGYSEYTPMDDDELAVGEHNIIEIVLRHKGENITLFVADEPFNILDDEV